MADRFVRVWSLTKQTGCSDYYRTPDDDDDEDDDVDDESNDETSDSDKCNRWSVDDEHH